MLRAVSDQGGEARPIGFSLEVSVRVGRPGIDIGEHLPWPMNATSSIVTPSQMNVRDEILRRSPTLAPFWISKDVPIFVPLPNSQSRKSGRPHRASRSRQSECLGAVGGTHARAALKLRLFDGCGRCRCTAIGVMMRLRRILRSHPRKRHCGIPVIPFGSERNRGPFLP
jgi:hypothetical protein